MYTDLKVKDILKPGDKIFLGFNLVWTGDSFLLINGFTKINGSVSDNRMKKQPTFTKDKQLVDEFRDVKLSDSEW